MIELNAIVAVQPDVVGQRLEDEAILVTAATGTVKVVNQVGARVWELADGGQTVAQIAAQIYQEYNVPLQQAQLDVQTFVTQMIEKGVFYVAQNQ